MWFRPASGIGCSVFAELLAYVGYNDDDDLALRDVWPSVRPHLSEVVAVFYDRIAEFPGAVAVFADDAQRDRLKKSLARWLEELFTSEKDATYYTRRVAIGRAHVRVQLPSRYMFTAMSVVRSRLRMLVAHHAQATIALDKLLDVDLAIMTGTYLEESERDQLAKLRDLIVSHLPACILVLDDDTVVTSATSTAAPFLRGNPIGRRASDVLSFDVATAIDLTEMVRAARETKTQQDIPRTDITRDGERRSLRLSVFPVDHPLAAALVHIEDLTTVVSHEERAKNAEKLASLGLMAASVAHEIRNPLAGISGVVQVIMATLTEDDERRRALARVQEQITRLGELIGELLLFARPVKASMSSVNLRFIVGHAVDMAKVGLPGKVTVGGEGRAMGDTVLIAQVLQNLVQNALQAGAATVNIDIKDGVIDVRDDGPGIPHKVRDQVFVPFFTTKARGTGLGLPMAQRIAEAMDGALELMPSSTGAHFRLSLKRE